MSLAMSSVACSSPPGVSNRKISASYPPVRASSIASLMNSTVERSIAPVTSARSTRGPWARVDGIAMTTSDVKRTISRTARAGLPAPGVSNTLAPPRSGRFNEEDLDPLAQVLTLREELVELDLAEDVPQSGLGEQIRRLDVVLDLRHGLQRIVHAVVDHRIDLDGHVVPAHDALTRHIEGDDPQVDEDPTVEDRDDHRQAGSLRLAQEATESEDHEPFVFPNHLDRPPQDPGHQDDDQYRRKDEFLSRHASIPRDDKARSANKRVGRDYPAAGRMGRTESSYTSK